MPFILYSIYYKLGVKIFLKMPTRNPSLINMTDDCRIQCMLTYQLFDVAQFVLKMFYVASACYGKCCFVSPCVLGTFGCRYLNKCFNSIKLMQVSHVRSLHTSGCGQQQEAVAVESEPVPLSVFRTQENDPVSKSDFNSSNVVIMLTGQGNTLYSCLIAADLCLSSLFVSFQACQSQKHIGQYYTLPPAHIRTLFPHGLSWRYQQQVCAYVCDSVHIILNLLTQMIF